MRSLKCLLISISIGTTLILSGCGDKTKEVVSPTSNVSTSSSQNSSASSNSSTSSAGNTETKSSSTNTSGSSNSTSSNNAATTTSSSQTSTSATYKDGTYTGTARGFKPGLTVSVTVASGKISNVEITAHHESRGYYEEPFQVVPQEIIAAQSTKVDAVSGATRSSQGIMNAVANALQTAKA